MKREIEKHIDDLPHYSRLLDGALICANAARSIVTQSLQFADRGLKSTLLSVSPTYLAAVILALGVLRQPNSRLVRSDIELLASATEYVETWYLQRGFSPAFTQTCTQLRERVVSVFQRSATGGGQKFISTSASSTDPGSELPADQLSRSSVTGFSAEHSHSLASGGRGAPRSSLPGAVAPNMVDRPQSAEMFGSFEFEDLWNMTDLDFMVYDEENPLFAQ